jgi:hypothetical protein
MELRKQPNSHKAEQQHGILEEGAKYNAITALVGIHEFVRSFSSAARAVKDKCYCEMLDTTESLVAGDCALDEMVKGFRAGS